MNLFAVSHAAASRRYVETFLREMKDALSGLERGGAVERTAAAASAAGAAERLSVDAA